MGKIGLMLEGGGMKCPDPNPHPQTHTQTMSSYSKS